MLSFFFSFAYKAIPYIVLLLCQTQINLHRQWHDEGTAAVSNVEPNSVAPSSKDKTNHPSSLKTAKLLKIHLKKYEFSSARQQHADWKQVVLLPCGTLRNKSSSSQIILF